MSHSFATGPSHRRGGRSLRACAQISVASIALWAAATAQAQSGDDNSAGGPSEVIVTGSRIARPIGDQLQPTIKVDGDFIRERGITNVTDALEQIPGVSFGASSAGNQNGYSLGQNFVNLYGIGSQRTLVLVNGRRFTPGQTQAIFSNDNAGVQVDLNTIPTDLIDHIETISVGGSSIYGADAIAGTVNIIMKNDFQGITGDVQFGRSGRGDANSYSARSAFGVNTDDKRGNMTFALEFNQQDGITEAQRPFGAAQYSYVANPNGGPNIFIRGLRNPFANTNGVIYGTNQNSFPDAPPNGGLLQGANGNFLQFAPGGNIVSYNPGTVFPDGNAQGGQGYNNAYYTQLLSNTKRVNASLLAHYDVSDYATAYTELYYSHNTASSVTGSPSFNSSQYNGATTVPGEYPYGSIQFSANNLFLTPQAQSVLAGAGITGSMPFYLSRQEPELGGYSPTTGTQDQFDAVFGVRGDFDLFSRRAHYDLSLTAGGNYSSINSPQFVEQNFLNAIGAVGYPNGQIVAQGPVRNAAGQLVCPISLSSPNSNCAPLNLFGFGSPSQSAINYIVQNDISTNTLQQEDVNGTISMPVFDLPAGPVSIATGFEYRRDHSAFSAGPIEAGGLGLTIPVGNIAGGYTSTEGYGELLIPVISPTMDIPLVHSLEAEGSYRRVDNNVAGSDHALTAGGRYAPIADFQFRGNFSHSIRAPAVTELYYANQQFFEGATDPCDSAQLNSGPNPAIRQRNCAAAEAAAGYTGGTANFLSNADNQTIPGLLKGNTALKNEISDSWTAGVVINPSFEPRFSASVDWVHLHVANTINSVGSTQILQACYDNPVFPNPACGLVSRYNTTNAINGLQPFYLASIGNPYQNGGFIDYQGLQSQVAYHFDLDELPLEVKDIGSLNIQALLNYIGSYNTVTGTGAFASPQPYTDSVGNPRFRGQLNVTYKYDAFSLLWQTQYQSAANINDLYNSSTQNILRVGTYWLFNATASYDINENIRVRAIVNNLLDRQPPYGLSSSGIYNPSNGAVGNYDTLGRYIQFGISAQF